MTDKKESPYSSFLNKEAGSDNENDDLDNPSDELLNADRGETELTPEENNVAVNKNIIIAIVLIIMSVIAVGIFVYMLIAKTGVGGGDDVVSPESVAVLEEVQTNNKIDSIQDRIQKESNRLEEIKNAERRRQLAEATRIEAERRKAAEAAAAKAKAEREEAERIAQLEAEKAAQNPGPASTSTLPAPPVREMTLAEMAELDSKELTSHQHAKVRKASNDVLGYQHQAGSTPPPIPDMGGNPPNALGSMLSTELMPNGAAYVRSSRKYLLLRGTNIDCTLLPRMVTSYPSQPSCIVNKDVYSPEGVVLVDRGSKVIGEQRTAMQAGKSKVFIAWANVETPEGVSIKIDSMAADQLGGSGVDAWIDNHYPERFGGAIMLSMIDDLFQSLVNNKSEAEYNFDASSDTATSMAEIVLENSIDIEPTGYIMPAAQITIMVARDIDFSEIYEAK